MEAILHDRDRGDRSRLGEMVGIDVTETEVGARGRVRHNAGRECAQRQLAIVHHLVEAHGGTVNAISAGKGMGATFTVTIPLMTGAAARHESLDDGLPTPEFAGALKGVRLLVVDDDSATREALGEMLGLVGAEVSLAESAPSALRVLEYFTPDLLICDVAMPGEDGYTLLRRLRATGTGRGSHVPALALTVLAGEDDRRRAIEAGFQMQMAKPVDFDRLAATLVRLLSREQVPGTG